MASPILVSTLSSSCSMRLMMPVTLLDRRSWPTTCTSSLGCSLCSATHTHTISGLTSSWLQMARAQV